MKACHFLSIELGIVVRGTNCHATRQGSIPYKNESEWVYSNWLDPNTCSRNIFMVWRRADQAEWGQGSSLRIQMGDDLKGNLGRTRLGRLINDTDDRQFDKTQIMQSWGSH